MKPILIEISPGELLDRLSILQLKLQHLPPGPKQAQVQEQINALSRLSQSSLPPSPQLQALSDQLTAINQRLWQVEDELRLCEKRRDFSPQFIELARSVYHLNDRRSALKQEVNQFLGWTVNEEKVYA